MHEHSIPGLEYKNYIIKNQILLHAQYISLRQSVRCVCVLTVGEALCDGGPGIRVGATLPLDVSFLNSPQETMVTLMRYT